MTIAPLKPFDKPKTAEEAEAAVPLVNGVQGAAKAGAEGGVVVNDDQQQVLHRAPSEGKGALVKDRSKSKIQEAKVSFRRRKFRSFDNITGFSGIFMSGERPGWIMHSHKGLFFHPMGVDGAIYCFTSFHNVNCANGFVYFNSKGSLRISLLPTYMTYDFPWVVRKVPFRRTVHNITYHLDSSTYIVVGKFITFFLFSFLLGLLKIFSFLLFLFLFVLVHLSSRSLPEACGAT